MSRKSLPLAAALLAALVLISGCNLSGSTTEVETVTFSPNGGTINYGDTVTLSCKTKDAVIYYSFDSKFNPSNYLKKGTEGSSVEITKTGTVTLYAVAADSSGNTSTRTKAAFEVLTTENSALYLGNPSNAVTDVSYTENYLMEKSTYALSYNNTTHNPNWVSWHLCSDDLGSVTRSDKRSDGTGFHADKDLPEGWYRVLYSDYTNSGFTRGHMIPSNDRTLTNEENDEVFLMTNMVPQTKNNNNTVWEGLEDLEINSFVKSSGKELYIICGPYGMGGNYAGPSSDTVVTYSADYYGNLETVNYIPLKNTEDAGYSEDDNGIVVPASTWRVEIILDEGEGDLSRIDSDTTVIAINVPNTYECLYTETGTKKSWTDYITTIDAIEELTGYDFFANLPDDVEAVLEAKVYEP